MKKIAIIVTFLLCLGYTEVKATSLEEIRKAEDGLSITAQSNIMEIGESFSFYDTAKSITEGNYTADPGGIIKKVLDTVMGEVRANADIMGTVILFGVLCSFLSNLSFSFGSGGTSEASFICAYAVLAGISATGFYEISECAKTAINDMGLFVKALIPVLTSLSAAEGRVISASVLHTQVLATTAISSIIIENVIMPLTYAAFVIKFVNNMTETVSLNNLGKMADRLSKRIMSFMMLIFTGTLTLSSFAAGTAENMGMKTARFALNTFIPVTGGALAETVTSICASAGMIKNSAGIAGIIAIVLMAAYPVIKCAVVSFIYNFAGAVLEPVCDIRLSKAVTSVGECMGMLLGIVSVSAAQYVISAAVMLTVYGR